MTSPNGSPGRRSSSRGRQEELRRLGRGLHPRQLAEDGLAAALASLAHDIPVRVQLAVSAGSTTPAAAACAYFVCAEALANVAKYASASQVTVSVRADSDGIRVDVADDGTGGADPTRGTGLRGLADRVETLGGTLTVDSPPGRGTRVAGGDPVRRRADLNGAARRRTAAGQCARVQPGWDAQRRAGRRRGLQPPDLLDERAGLRIGLQVLVHGRQ